MMPPLKRVRASKNLSLNRFEAESSIDRAADTVRTRFATPGKHQIYADKRNEAERYLTEAQSGELPNLAGFPYLSAETGITAETAADLAELWIFMDSQWKQVAALIEQITIGAKAQVRTAASQAEIDTIIATAAAYLDQIGERPPERPPQKQ